MAAPTQFGTILGVLGIGKGNTELKVSLGLWTAGTSLSYQWLKDEVVIPGATSDTYMVSDLDFQSKISVRVLGVLAGYEDLTRTSNPILISMMSERSTRVPATPLVKFRTGANSIGLILSQPDDPEAGYWQGYQVSLDGGAWFDVSPTANGYVLNKLTNEREYSVQVRAKNGNGFSAPAAAIKATPTLKKPATPKGLKITAGDRSAVIAIDPPSDYTSTSLTGYQYTLDGTNWLDAPFVNNRFTLSGLTNGIVSRISLRALNLNGTSTPVAGFFKPVAQASAPRLVSLTPADRSLKLRVGEPLNLGGGKTLRYEYSIDLGNTWTQVSPAKAAGGFVIPGLINGSVYTIWVRAVTEAGPGAVLIGNSMAPGRVPEMPKLTLVSTTSSTITFTITRPEVNGGSAVTEYRYFDGSKWTTVTASPGSTSVTVRGLNAFTTYKLFARAVNSFGESKSSLNLTVKTSK